MTYVTATQMLLRFTANRMAELSQPEPGETVVGDLLQLTVDGGDRSAYSAAEQASADKALAAINAGISDAGNTIDSYLKATYALPLTQAVIDVSPLPRYCGDIVVYYLVDDLATEEVEKRHKAALAWLRDVAAGKATLGEQDTAVSTSRIKVAPGVSAYDWGQY